MNPVVARLPLMPVCFYTCENIAIFGCPPQSNFFHLPEWLVKSHKMLTFLKTLVICAEPEPEADSPMSGSGLAAANGSLLFGDKATSCGM